MGSEFSNADLSVGNIEDFSYQLEGTETIDQELCWKIRTTPLNAKIADEYGVSYKTYWISQKDFMPRKTTFTDQEGKLWKEMYLSGIKLMDAKNGKYFISKMEIKNIKNGRSSKMEMTQMLFNPNINEAYFTLVYIEKQ